MAAPSAFRDTLTSKGWSMVNLAWRWKISPEYLSRLASDPHRDPWWNDALAGLPKLTPRQAREMDRQRLAAQPQKKRTRTQTDRFQGNGYRYHNDLAPGAGVALAVDLGDLREGTRGVVKERVDTGQQEKYLLDFEGYTDWYLPDDIDRMVVATGL